MSAPSRRHWQHLGLFGLGLVALATVAFLGVQPGSWRDQPGLFAGAALVLGLCTVLGQEMVRLGPVSRLGLSWILIIGAGLLLGGLRIAPSDDVYRYILEGEQLRHGQNPYAIAPAAPEAQALVTADIYAAINHPHMTAIYPPLALGLHATVQATASGPRGFQLCMMALAVMCVGLVTWLLPRMGRDPAAVLTLAWNPVLPLFVAGEAHHDVAMALLMLIACAAAGANRPWGAVIATGLAALVKPFALALIPALMPAQLHKSAWLRWMLLPVLALLALVVYLPFLDAGSMLWASLATYGGERHFHGALDPWLRAALRPLVATAQLELLIRVCLVVVLLGGGWWLHRCFKDVALITRAVAFSTLLLLCLPTIHPWYFTMLVVLLPFSDSRILPVWTAGAGLYWLHGLRILETGAWTETLWVTAVAHLPIIAGLGLEYQRRVGLFAGIPVRR